jgi:hypothetical protein
MRRLLAGLALYVVLAPDAGGQAIFGTYTTTPVQGSAPVTLVLQKDPQGKVTGSLSGNGVSYAVQGEMQGEDVAGSLSGGGMRSYFEAHREGAQLRVIMADAGPDGKPDYAKAREAVFSAVSGSATSVSGPATTSAGASVRSTPGNPLASGGATDKFTGTFTSTDVTLSLKRAGAGYAGIIRYRGEDYPATARADGETLAGSFKAGGQSYDLTIASAGDGRFVSLTTGGATYMLARSGAGSANPLAGGAPSATSGGMSPGANAQDQQLANLLTSTAWCSFSYSGSSTYAGTSSGTTRSSRSVFSPDGLVVETKNGESVNSGAAGTAYGSNSNGQQGRWKIENGQLMLSANGVQWVLQPMKIADNGNGYPFFTTAGKEYMMCK